MLQRPVVADCAPLLQVLGIVVGVLIQDHDVRQTEFQQLPYHRIFIMLLLELNAPEHVLETINFQTLTAFWWDVIHKISFHVKFYLMEPDLFKNEIKSLQCRSLLRYPVTKIGSPSFHNQPFLLFRPN